MNEFFTTVTQSLRRLISVAVILFIIIQFQNAVAASGENTFKSTCAACHTIGKGKLVGPDLKDISKKRSPEWLHKWIKSSQTLVKSGDSIAVSIFNEFNNIPMPDQNLSDEQIDELLAYIEEAPSKTAKPVTPVNADHKITNPETHLAVQAENPDMFNTLGFGNYVLLLLFLFLTIIGFVLFLAIKTIGEEINDGTSAGETPDHLSH